MKRNLFLGMAFIMTAGLFWGALGTAVQFLYMSGSGFTPLGLVTLRQLWAGFVLIAATSIVMPRRIWGVFKSFENVRDIFVSGILIFASHYAFFESIYYSNAGTAAIFLTLIPLIAALWYAVRKHEMISRPEMVSFLLATAGVVLIVTNGNLGTLAFSPLAISWGLFSVLTAAAWSIQPLGVVARVGVVPVLAWSIVVGGIIASFFCPPWTIEVQWNVMSATSFAFIVLFGTIGAFGCYLTGLKHVTPVIAGLLNCMEPLSAFLFSIALLGVRLGSWQVVGIALVLANVCVLALFKKAK